MAKSTKSKKTETPPEVPAETQTTEAVTETSAESVETNIEQPKAPKKAKTTEVDEHAAVGLQRFQCPRCKTMNSEQNVTGTPHRKSRRGFHEGKEYSVVIRSQVFCSHCGDTFVQSDFQ